MRRRLTEFDEYRAFIRQHELLGRWELDPIEIPDGLDAGALVKFARNARKKDVAKFKALVDNPAKSLKFQGKSVKESTLGKAVTYSYLLDPRWSTSANLVVETATRDGQDVVDEGRAVAGKILVGGGGGMVERRRGGHKQSGREKRAEPALEVFGHGIHTLDAFGCFGHGIHTLDAFGCGRIQFLVF